MDTLALSEEQFHIVQAPLQSRLALSGSAGCGKTTAGVARLQHLLSRDIPGEKILILAPQRTLAQPYYRILHSSTLPPGGIPSVLTIGGLARRLVELFWPVVSEAAGFDHPQERPRFLTLETAQYFLARLLQPLLEQGYFASLTIDPNRLYSQVLDNLNKSAVVGFPLEELAARLGSSGAVGRAHPRTLDELQEVVQSFRQFCFRHNLLDYSLQIELFRTQIWPLPACRDMVKNAFQHLIYENVEEDVPVAHDVVKTWLPDLESSLLISDTDGGYRVFLGADTESARDLLADQEEVVFTRSFTNPAPLRALRTALQSAIQHAPQMDASPAIRTVWENSYFNFTTQMVDATAAEIVRLVRDEAVPLSQIVVLAPFMSDTLRFSLAQRLDAAGIASQTLRPSRSLVDEPAARCMLTFARLAHPAWEMPVSSQDVRAAFQQTIANGDLLRADLLVRIYHRSSGKKVSFSQLDSTMQERITFSAGSRFENLDAWLEAYAEQPPEELDAFLSRLFGEVLSQPGFGFHRNFTAASVISQLVDSVRKFRWVMQDLLPPGQSLGKEYLQTALSGVLAAQYLPAWDLIQEEAVLIAPAYTFLLANRPVEVQFWLDAGSQGWWERIDQPLTQPYVLARSWPAGKIWTDDIQYLTNQNSMSRLVDGLLCRCRHRVYFHSARVNASGYEEKGALLQASQKVLKALAAEEGGPHA